MAYRIVDADNVERDWAWVAAAGYVIGPQDVIEFSGYGMHLIELRETRGPAVIQVMLQNEDGTPNANQLYVGRWWNGLVPAVAALPYILEDPNHDLGYRLPVPQTPEMEEHAVTAAAQIVVLGPEIKTVPGINSRVALVQQCDINSGDTGFGIGSGDVIHADGGPTSVCVTSPTYPSAIVRRLGWLGGTEHWGMLKLTYRLGTLDTGGNGGGDTPPPSGTLREKLLAAKVELDHLVNAKTLIDEALAIIG